MKTFLQTYIENHKEEMLQDLAGFVAIPSVSSDLEKVTEALDFALNLGQKMGFRTENCLDGQVGVIEMGEGDETLGILAHVDVVPAGDPADWDSDPFAMTIKDDKIFGRGTIDDKGMIIASLYAMKGVMESGLPLHKKVQLILGTQEEVEWTDMAAYVTAYPLPDYGFSPDGEFPICNIEKGVADCKMDFYIGDDIEKEGDQLRVEEIHCGIAANSVPGRATATLSNGEIIVAEGKAVHACQPEEGDNAIFRLCEKLQQSDIAKTPLMTLLEAVTASFRDMYGEAIGMYSESEYYEGEFVHRNVFTPTLFHTEGDTATLNINLRFPYGVEEQALLDAMTKFAEEHGGHITLWDFLPAVFVSRERPFLQYLADAYEDVTGLQNEYTLAYGGSYAKAMPNVVSWGPLFPGEADPCHEVNEYLFIKSLMDSTKIFAQAIAGIALTESSLK